MTDAFQPDRILLRYGEVGLKSDNVRRRFEDRLLGNIRSGLDRNDIEYEIEKERGRIYVVTEEIDEATEILQRVFGLVSLSPVETVTVGSSLEDIVDTAGRIGEDYIDEDDSFSVRARRTGNQNFTSKMIEREAGAEVQGRTLAEVDLEEPDKTLYIEVRQNKAYFFLEKVDAPGGLPLGTQGRVAVLFSGSTDSVVAAWQMMKRGCRITPIYFDCSPYTGESNDERVEEVLEELEEWAYGDRLNLVTIPHGKSLFLFTEECDDSYLDILSKRQMVRVANRVAEEVGAKAIVTGDNLNQDISQTLGNMSAIEDASTLPVFRPVVTWDKEDIQRFSEEIGVFNAAVEEVDEPPHARRPRPDMSLDDIRKEEGKIEIEDLVDQAMEEAQGL